MSSRNRSARCSNTYNRRSRSLVATSNPSQAPTRRGNHSENLQSYKDPYQLSSCPSSRHTTVTNVKVLHNGQDAKDYIRSIIHLLEIDDQGDGKTFIQQLLERTDRITTPSDLPLEYLITQDCEICYVLVAVETKKNRIEIGYSYHCVPNDGRTGDSDNCLRSKPQQLLDWFRGRAREALRLPAGIVTVMVNNQKAMDDFQSKQLSPEEPYEPPTKQICNYQQQQRCITNGQSMMNPNRR